MRNSSNACAETVLAYRMLSMKMPMKTVDDASMWKLNVDANDDDGGRWRPKTSRKTKRVLRCCLQN